METMKLNLLNIFLGKQCFVFCFVLFAFCLIIQKTHQQHLCSL